MAKDQIAILNNKIDSFLIQGNRKFNVLYWMINVALVLNLAILFKLFS